MTLRDTEPAAPPGAGVRRPSARRPAGQSRDILSRNSYAPLYYQLTAILEERAESGEYAPGQEFPSERELCEEFDVSRTVVRPAMAILEREGRIGRSKGKRTVVKPPKAPLRMGGILRALAAARAGATSELIVLESRREAPDHETAAILELAEREPVLRLAAVSFEDGVPLALHWSYLSASSFAWLAELPAGQRLTGAEPQIPTIALARGEATVESSWCTEFEAAELDVSVGTPIFVMRGIERAQTSPRARPAVEVAWTMYRADAARLHVALEPTAPDAAQPR